MPQPVRTRLAKACQGLQLPSGAVVFEEDDKGDAMYVVVSGALQVRARPLNTGAAAAAARGEQPQQDGQLGAAAGTGADAGGLQASSMDGGARKQRATTDAVCAGADRSSSGSGSGADRGVLGELTGSRRTTWEGVAFTAKEQSKLDAVRNALEAEKQQVRQPFSNNAKPLVVAVLVCLAARLCVLSFHMQCSRRQAKVFKHTQMPRCRMILTLPAA